MRRRHSGSSREEDESYSTSSSLGDGADDHASADYNSHSRSRATESRQVGANAQLQHQQEEAIIALSPHTYSPISTTRKRSAESVKRLVGPETGAAASAERTDSPHTSLRSLQIDDTDVDMLPDGRMKHRARLRSPWSCSFLTLATTLVAIVILASIGQSFLITHLDPKGCQMSWMRAAFAKFDDFDTEYTRFATKYSLYLYREGGVDEDTRVKGVPVLFIPGNAGSYKQVRPIAAEAAYHFQDVISNDELALAAGKRPFDFFSVDFNEDITAFHGQTLLDQADYLNDAISYILHLYGDPHRSFRDPSLPDPTSVIIVGHSMGGIVARTMVTRPNYLPNNINTIITLSAPHARAPVSFDADIVHIYEDINNYWRKSYAQPWASKNPLWQMTLVSIAGGGLDNVVPSDYASLTSIVPETHGFTVFTSSIPYVWTGMDHLAIMWCDQFRKAVVRALFDMIDVTRPSQTRSRAERITKFRKHFLTGLEPVVEKQLPAQESRLLLTHEDDSTVLKMHKHRLVLSALGQQEKPVAHILPIPKVIASKPQRFTVLADQPLNEDGALEVFLCGLKPHQQDAHEAYLDLANGKAGTNRLTCRSAAVDVVPLPASRANSEYAFDQAQPFSYLEYDLADIADYNYVAVLDRTTQSSTGFVIAEFAQISNSTVVIEKGFAGLLFSGAKAELAAARPLVTSIHIPALHSSMLAYKVSIKQDCTNSEQLFRPLLRQYIMKPYETKFFPNAAGELSISLHGVSPYITPPLSTTHNEDGLSLQIWSDPSCNGTFSLELHVDVFGSAGKLYMRYRTVFAAFPLLVVALVIRKQFKMYNATGIFISFTEAMDLCIRTSLPLIFLALTFLALSLARADKHHTMLPPATGGSSQQPDSSAATESLLAYTKNELLLGSYDPFFWFLVPLFGLIGVGICIAVNYAVLALVHGISVVLSAVSRARGDDGRRPLVSFSATSSLQRVITTGILVLLVATVIPYQFAYLVLCIVQLITCVRALRQAWDSHTHHSTSLYNYTHTLLVLLLWILPINLPVLVVWIHNLAVPYLTPFSSHHNIISIAPFILLVETISTGHMIPRLTSPMVPRLVTNVLLFAVAVWSAVYGVTWAYTLHYAINGVCAWLFAVHVLGGMANGQQGVAVPASGGVTASGAVRSTNGRVNGFEGGSGGGWWDGVVGRRGGAGDRVKRP